MRITASVLRLAVCAGLTSLVTACGTASANGPARVAFDTLANGVIKVTNPERGTWGEATAWHAVEDLRIGEVDGGGPTMLGAPIDVEEDALGRIFVLDAAANEIRVFDAAGRHVRTFGRQGRGPGEFRQPMGMALSPAGEIWVVDPMNARFSVFDTAGTFLRSYLRHSSSAMLPWPGIVDASGRLYEVGSDEKDGEQISVLVRYDGSLERADTFALPHRREAQFELARDRGSATVPVPFAPRLEWALGPDGLVWSGASERFRLEVSRPGGGTLRIAERPHTPVSVERAEVDSAAKQLEAFVQQGGNVDLGAVPKTKPAFASIRVDDRGYAWLRASTPLTERNAAFDVFDPEGRYLGRVTLPIETPDLLPLVIRRNHVYAVVMTELGVPQVVRFRLEGREA